MVQGKRPAAILLENPNKAGGHLGKLPPTTEDVEFDPKKELLEIREHIKDIYEEDAYIQKVKEAFPDDFEEVLLLYPHSSEQEIERSATDLASDKFISYSTWKWFERIVHVSTRSPENASTWRRVLRNTSRSCVPKTKLRSTTLLTQ